MRKHIAIVLLAAALLLLCACSSVRGRTDRYDGFTIRTEKTGGAAPESVSDVPTRAADNENEMDDYVLNKSSMKFHDPSCTGVKDILTKNRLDYHGTRQSVLDMGYFPCKICNP